MKKILSLFLMLMIVTAVAGCNQDPILKHELSLFISGFLGDWWIHFFSITFYIFGVLILLLLLLFFMFYRVIKNLNPVFKGIGAIIIITLFVAGGWYEYTKLIHHPLSTKVGLNQSNQDITYLKKACDGGTYKGCILLGMMYYEGQGVTQDFQKALFFFKKACDGDNADGCAGIGDMYVLGNKRIRGQVFHFDKL